jgi:ADP-heptose:LPS heptosyltransferase
MKLETPISILVRRRAALGDVVVATGLLRELKAKYGDNCVIDVATEYPSVFANNPHVRNVIKIDEVNDSASKPADYNVYYNLDDTYEHNPNSHFADNYYYRTFGTTDMDRSMELFITDEEAVAVDEFVASIGAPFIAVHMRRWHWEMKNIDPAIWLSTFDAIFEANQDVKIVCVGGPTDFFPEGHPRVIDGRGIYNPGSLSYLLDHAKCFVGIDSGPFHIAGTSETHIVALLSHMYPEKVLPFRNGVMGHNCTVVQAKVDCLGCHSRQQRPIRRIVCERGDFACNKLWDVAEIANAIVKQL